MSDAICANGHRLDTPGAWQSDGRVMRCAGCLQGRPAEVKVPAEQGAEECGQGHNEWRYYASGKRKCLPCGRERDRLRRQAKR